MADFNATAVLETEHHRPWPIPHEPWVMTQTWNDLLFAHWAVPKASVRRRVPSEFEIDLFDDAAWIGVVPFHMTNVAPRGVPAMPWVSEFPELNVRTYVRVSDRPGVYFFSLDAGSAMAVQAARLLLNLPYYSAEMKVTPHANDQIEYSSRRSGAEDEAAFSGTYQPIGEPFRPVKGSLEHFLTERYCLYNLNRAGAPYRLDIHHAPWTLQRAKADITIKTVAASAGFELPNKPQLTHFAKRQDMLAWAPVMI